MSNEERLLEHPESIKLEKKLGKEYVAELRNLSKTELDQKMLDLAKYEQELITTKNDDEELETAKDKVKNLESPYKQDLAFNKARRRFVSLLLKEKFE